MAGVLVYSEDNELALQILGKGRELANKLGSDLESLIIGYRIDEPNIPIKANADIVHLVDDVKLGNFDVELYRTALLASIEKSSPEIILIGATKYGKELAPRVAAALNTGCMTECISLDLDDQRRLVAERLTYGGSSVALEVSRREPHIATVARRIFPKPEPTNKVGSVEKLQVTLPEPRVRIVERREKKRTDAGLEDATIIVAAGRGFRRKEDLELLEDLASVLGAKIGCTRPIAADSGWLEDWIGISGKKVRPKLYLACGVSGTIQHAAGIRDAQIIVSINQDEASNIFQLSDYGVVGDLYVVLPALTRALREREK